MSQTSNADAAFCCVQPTMESIRLDMPSERLIKQAKLWEGFRANPYMDAVGVLTWGYGQTQGPHPSQPWTEAEATLDLTARYAQAEHDMRKLFPAVALSPGQVDALTSFYDNVGPGSVGHKDGLHYLKPGGFSTLYQLIIAGLHKSAANEFPKWNLGAGKPLPGLTARRAIEREWYLEGLA